MPTQQPIRSLALTNGMAVRFLSDRPMPILSRHRTRYGDIVVLYAGIDRESVWIGVARGAATEIAQLPDAVVQTLANEAKRRHAVGLTQPHWAKIAAEWIYRGEIDMEMLSGETYIKMAAQF